MSVTVLNSLVESERLLWELLSLALQKRDTPAATLAALAAYSSPPDRSLVYVAAENRVYRYAKDSQQVADGLNVVSPASLPSAGRWLRITSPLTFGPNNNAPLQSRTSGFCNFVEVYQGDDGFEQMIERGYGKPPFLMIELVGAEPEPLSLNPGAVYREKVEFTVHCFSQCKRAPWAAAWGSPYPPEAAGDPGVLSLMSLVRYLCAGVRSGIDGVQRIEIGRAAVEYEDLDDRFFAGAVQVFVHVSYEIPDEDLGRPIELEAQPLEPVAPAAGAQAFDRNNYVSAGLFVEPGPGLSRTVPAGQAVIAGVVVVAPGGPVTLPPDSDVYRDLLPDGSLVYTAVAYDQPAALPAGALRIAVSRTSASDIESDTWLAGHAFELGSPIPILPPA